MNVGPLKDMLVLDLSRALAGPIAAMMLGDLGARVIKVEAPGTGDDSRTWGPPFVGPERDPHSSYFMSANRNKESIVLDLKSEHGRDALRRLIQRADVLIENLRPGAFDRLGFSAPVLEDLNSRLITLSITGFGHDGPEGSRPGYDQIAQGEAGLMSVTGGPNGEPTRIGVPIADVLAGVHGATGVSAALAGREKTGKGMVVRTSSRPPSVPTPSRARNGRSATRSPSGPATTIHRSPPTAVSAAPTVTCRSRSGASRSGRSSHRWRT